eukprot:836541-Amphidinium_carterae.1
MPLAPHRTRAQHELGLSRPQKGPTTRTITARCGVGFATRSRRHVATGLYHVNRWHLACRSGPAPLRA